MSFSKCKELIEEGDTVILYIGVSQIYALEVKPKLINKAGQPVDNVFQTRYGSLKVMDLIGEKFGSKVNLSKGWARVLYPTPELWTVTLPHRTQILYTPDISMVVMQLEIGPGSVVCEAGTGSGSVSHALLRTIGPTGKLYTCDFHKERAQVALDEFTRHGFGERVDVSHRDVYVEGLGVKGIANAVFLDLPKPWEALPHALSAIKDSGGRICSFSPCIEQVSRACELMASIGLQEITTLECLAREFQVKYISLPVISKDTQVDACESGVGAVLLQIGNKELQPIAYFSAKFQPHQRAYSTIEKEALALVMALEHFDVYVGQTSQVVTVYSDHNPLVYLQAMKNHNTRLMRWALRLQPYNIRIQYIAGKENVLADSLSRV
ncbi:tRNA (adenine(58)-N(1))-methyltransferase catalytic subunit TRMT61A isoform X2 [Cherax quadricarinatus]|uniref:tRNA (adenine(58)-N(1))-methyltransferase catalytic subunit TRMT61A isoform X2 n=1 Tax=Cherax quadricarinatus TaxID=27406 RepID=UPI00387E23DA